MTEWGSVAEIVSAGATVLALAAAGVAAKAALKTNKQQGQQLEQLRHEAATRREEAEQADASKVAFWARTSSRSNVPVLRYINASALPIYNPTILVAIPGHTFRVPYAVLGPSFEKRTMDGGTERLRAQAENLSSGPDWQQLLTNEKLRCAAYFRDGSSRWWLRDFDGRLSRRSNPAEADAAAMAGLAQLHSFT